MDNRAELIPVADKDLPFTWFNEPEKPTELYYKVYNDGSHYIATLACRSRRKNRQADDRERKDYDMLFDNLFADAVKQGLKGAALTSYVKSGMLKLFPEFEDIDEYVENRVKVKWHNLHVRRKRFRRKAYLNKWNYFVTFTYDDKKHNAETFRKKIRKCLSNLHTRRGWRYMGVFEEAPETGRLHFHGLLYVPDGEMIGKITEKKDYSTAQQKMQVTYSNDFFAENFGRNDFEELTEMELKYGHTLEYILKYIGKTDERIVYSRGIPTEICKKLPERDIVTAYIDYVEKFILFDNVINWERDVMNFTRYKQMTIISLLCNPRTAA